MAHWRRHRGTTGDLTRKPWSNGGVRGDQTGEAAERAARERPSFLDSRATGIDAMLSSDHPRKAAARLWAERELAGRGLDRETWRCCGEAGLFAMRIPSEQGGSGHSAVEALLTFEGLGLGCENAGLVFALGTQIFAFGACFVAGLLPNSVIAIFPACSAAIHTRRSR